MNIIGSVCPCCQRPMEVDKKKDGFHIDPRRLRKVMDEKQIGVIEATKIIRKEEALRRINELNESNEMRYFLVDLVEEIM